MQKFSGRSGHERSSPQPEVHRWGTSLSCESPRTSVQCRWRPRSRLCQRIRVSRRIHRDGFSRNPCNRTQNLESRSNNCRSYRATQLRSNWSSSARSNSHPAILRHPIFVDSTTPPSRWYSVPPTRESLLAGASPPDPCFWLWFSYFWKKITIDENKL